MSKKSLLLIALSFVLLTALLAAPSIEAAPILDTSLVASGLSDPLFVTGAPGDTSRLFILERAGKIRIVKNGTLLSQPFLDIVATVTSGGGEQGLLGLAFHPDYQNNGYFFVNYTRAAPTNDGATVVARYQVSSNPDSADETSATVILTQAQPYGNHNAGMLAFSPMDGYLYVGFGDGGSSGDPLDSGQDSTTWLGKMLRIDVDGGFPYAVPTDNPFVDSTGWLPEIWALGLRNPWRYTFDRANGDLYIADVGQNQWEEANYQPFTSTGGENYGWRLKEGDHCFNPISGCDTLSGLTDPFHEYEHTFGDPALRCSITGGYVYRGSAISGLIGAYVFADYCSGEIISFKWDGVAKSDSADYTEQINPDSSYIASFGEDTKGELYYCSYTFNSVVKIIQGQSTECCIGIRGNVNGDVNESIDISDLTYLVAYQFQQGPAPPNCP